MFESVDDLTFGYGYASVDAYENPLSVLTFHKATVEPATREDWQAWRDKAVAEYKDPGGMMPGPWGYSNGVKTSIDRVDNSNAFDSPSDFRGIAATCDGVIRLKLPEKIREEIRKHWPAHRPRYWTIYGSSRDESKPDLNKIVASNASVINGKPAPGYAYYGKYRFGQVGGAGLTYEGIPTRDGGGTIKNARWKREGSSANGPPNVPSPTYPTFPLSRSVIPGKVSDNPDYIFRTVIGDGEMMKGFTACGAGRFIDRRTNYLKENREVIGDTRGKPTFKHYVDSYEIYSENDRVNKSSITTFYVIENDEYVLLPHTWGRSML